MDIPQIEARLDLFAGMLCSCHPLYLWRYDSGFHLIRSNCPHQTAVDNLFTMLRDASFWHEKIAEQHTPMLLSNEVGLLWVTQPLLENGELIRTYVLGPLFLDDVSPKNMEQLWERKGLSLELRTAAMQFLRSLPIISLNRVFEYAIMLHHCVTDETITVSDLRYDDRHAAEATAPHALEEQTDIHGTYEAELEMVRMVREGDIQHYREHMDRLSMTGRMGKLSNGDPLRQMKNAVITCLVLFSRAAMEGGLSPELSYSLSDRYFQSIEACGSVPELVEIALPMQEDYIQRVHRIRNSGYSAAVQVCCDYIDLHLEDPIDLPLLAQQAGYTPYYLSNKFKAETGLPPTEYIRRQRLARAAHLLRTTQEDIQKIGARLQFCSQSHFSQSFRSFYGMTPTEWRKRL